jgi:uncharacterized sulfatase
MGLLLAVTACSACGRSAPQTNSEPPNIVLAIGDDHGYPYFGFMGSDVVKTPHLDRIAREGVTFPYGFSTASVCLPSLRSLLTGLHPEQYDAKYRKLWKDEELPEDTQDVGRLGTLPQLLGKAGYASFMGGKYWEGDHRAAGFTHGMEPAESKHLGRETMEPLWDFLDAHRDGPFFVWFAPMLPHHPHDAPHEYLEPYRDVALTPATRAYYANITRFDARLGELVSYLDQTGLRKRTVLIYLSDNGWQQGPGDPRSPWGGSHGKLSMYEPGFRTPILVSWPGRIRAERVDDSLVSSVDLFGTILDFAGMAPPADREGISLRPLLLESGGFDRKTVIGGMKGLRSSDSERGKAYGFFFRNAEWRYIWYPLRLLEGDELYRIAADPEEKHDLAREHPELTTRYRAEIVRWLEDIRHTYE